MTDRNYGAIRQAELFEKFADRILAAGKPFGFDIESGYVGEEKEGVALLPQHPDWIMVGFSFTNSLDWARYVPVAHDHGDNVDDVLRVARTFWKLLQSGLGVAHNASFEQNGLSRWFRDTLWDDPELGEQVRASNGLFPFRSDTMLEAWLSARYDPIRVGKGLKGLTKHIFKHEMVEFKALFPQEESELGPVTPARKMKYIRFNTRNLVPAVIEYACEDAVWCLALHLMHYDDVMKDSQLITVTELQLLPILVEMEQEALVLDWSHYERASGDVAVLLDKMSEEIMVELSERLGRTVNISLASPAQVAKVLFDEAPEGLGIEVKVRSEKTNAPSTSEKALRAIAKSDPILRRILTWREVAKLKGSYIDRYLTNFRYRKDGRGVPNHNQAGAGTGRMSVDGVSYQQWPKRYHFELKDGTVFDLNYKDLLLSPEDYRMVGFDFSQVELRVLAGLSQEHAMINAFETGVDIHRATASSMMNIPLEEVTDKQRSNGKTLNFAVVYGSGANNIAEMLTSPDAVVTKEDAERLLEQYYAGFPALRVWMDTKIAEGRQQGFVTTPFGRKFTVWEYKAAQDYIRKKGDRMCVNAPVQGGAADYMKIGMVRAHRAIRKAEAEGVIPKRGIIMLLTVHDNLEFYVHKSVATQTVLDLIGPAVSFPLKGFPIIKADWEEGYQWGSMVDIELDADGQIERYVKKVELPDKTSVKWDGTSLHEVLDPYYVWSREHYGENYGGLDYYRTHNPDAPADPAPEPEGKTLVITKDEPEEVLTDHSADFEPAPKKNASKAKGTLTGAGDLLDVPTNYEADTEEPSWLHAPEWHNAQEPESEQTIVLALSEQPTTENWPRFQSFLDAHPGPMAVRIEMPEGVMTLDTQHRFGPDDQPFLSLMFGGATVRLEAPERPAALVEGLTL